MIRISKSIFTATSRKVQVATTSHLRTYASSTAVAAALPYHLVVGLPALSPTMDSGSLAEWYVKEGDKFSAGDAVAKIETDKASIDFEAQDDGFVAKLLQPVGVDLAVGTPIMITVEEETDVAAFADYILPQQEEVAPVAALAPPPVAPPVVEAKPTAQPPVPSPPPPPSVAAPAAASIASTPAPPVAAVTPSSPAAVAYGFSTAKVSPLAKTLAAQQKAYIERYGTTGQRPIM